MQVMICHNSHCRGKVQAPHPAPDRDFVAWVLFPDLCWKAEGLLSKKKIISMPDISSRITARGKFTE